MKKYLVTGAAGFIGSNYVEYILKKYGNEIEIIIVDCLTYAGNIETIKEILEDKRVKFEKIDIRNKKELEKIFIENEIDYIVNFAAETHVDRSNNNRSLFLETNVLGFNNLIELVKKYWTVGQNDKLEYKKNKKILQISTDEVYGSLEIRYKDGIKLENKKINKLLNKREITVYGTDFFKETDKINANNNYSISKSMADYLAISTYKIEKIPINITRCSNNYGKNQFPEKLIPLAIKNIIDGKKVPIYGNGENIRDWINVEDHCRAIELVLKKGKLGEIYNISSFNEEKNINVIKKIVEIIRDELENNKKYKEIIKLKKEEINFEKMVEYVKDRPFHDKRYATDSMKIIEELGWRPKIKFEDGLRETIKWYLENQKWLEKVSL